MNRTFEVRNVVNAWQGGEVLPHGFHPMTGRYFSTKAGRLACKRALQRRLAEMGVSWDEERPKSEAADLGGWQEES